jgi:hypothetical protein
LRRTRFRARQRAGFGTRRRTGSVLGEAPVSSSSTARRRAGTAASNRWGRHWERTRRRAGGCTRRRTGSELGRELGLHWATHSVQCSERAGLGTQATHLGSVPGEAPGAQAALPGLSSRDRLLGNRWRAALGAKPGRRAGPAPGDALGSLIPAESWGCIEATHRFSARSWLGT